MSASGAPPLLAFGLYAAAVVAVATLIPVLSWLLGERHRGGAAGEPYESGIMGTGTADIRFDVRYYLVAVFFIIFDVAAVFLFAWAAALREAGWPAFAVVGAFVGVLLAALVYLFRTGAFRWTGRLASREEPPRAGGRGAA